MATDTGAAGPGKRRQQIPGVAEARALRISVSASLPVGAVGIAWGLAVESRLVLFDSVFTIFGTALSGLSLLASWAAGLEPDDRYPFGRGSVIPVSILIQGAALMATLAYAAFDWWMPENGMSQRRTGCIDR